MPEIFNEVLSRELLQVAGQDKAKDLNEAIVGALEDTCPKVMKSKKAIPWWNKTLTRRRARVRKSRAKFQRCGNPDRRAVLQGEYRRQRNV